MIVLEPCPSCGHQSKDGPDYRDTIYPVGRERDWFTVACNETEGGCGAVEAFGRSPEEAALRWNSLSGKRLDDIPSVMAPDAVDEYLRKPGVVEFLARHHPAALVRGLASQIAQSKVKPPVRRVGRGAESTIAPAATCQCEACTPNTIENMRMILCATCGNKRCPHATDHRNACTNSNLPGQKGSSWEHVKPFNAQEPMA